jgi:hypothetical protein
MNVLAEEGEVRACISVMSAPPMKEGGLDEGVGALVRMTARRVGWVESVVRVCWSSWRRKEVTMLSLWGLERIIVAMWWSGEGEVIV